MSLAPGTRFGPYRIDAPIGAGGMGEVYRATDTRLPRPVAIKVLLAGVGDDPGRRARFEREARTIGTLNHPHICTLFDIGEHDGRSFIVMELVEGDTLAHRIERGALPLEDALRYGVEIAGALDRAHRQGIVHRDLKPANVMITRTGVKLLDFGLAKYKPGASSSESVLPTRAADGTAEGSILGTLQYMSPEQLEAREADARSDIFAFGAVLYEMVTGRKAFTGASQASLISAILRDQPAAMASLQPLAPASLDRVVATCLQKDPEERWQSAGDVGRELKWVADDARLVKGVGVPSSVAARVSASSGVRPWWRIAAALLLIAASMAVGWTLRRAPATPSWIFTRLTTDAGLADHPALSPDGKLVAYSSDRSGDGRRDIYVRQVAGGQPIQLTTDGAGNTMPDFSPDGARIVFQSRRESGGIYEISTLGGDPRLVAPSGLNPKYSPDGSHVAYWVGAPSIAPAVPGSGTVWVARLGGSAPRQIGSTFFTAARHPIWSPDGSKLMVLGYTSTQAYDPSGIDWWVAPLNGGTVVRAGAYAVVQRAGLRAPRATTGARVTVRAELPAPSCWSSSAGTVVFVAAMGDADDVWELPVSWPAGLTSGSPARLTASASTEAHVACTSSGSIAFTDLNGRDDVWLTSDLAGANRGEAPRRITQEPAYREHAALSRSGQHVAFASDQSGRLNIWVKDVLTGRESIVSASPGTQRFPVLDHAGVRVAYSVLEPDRRALYVSSPGGVAQRVCDDCLRATDWSIDGKTLLIFRGSPYEISTLDVASHLQKVLLKHPTRHVVYGRFSPDGRWVSFTERIGETQARIRIAPIDGQAPVPESAWITIADGEQDDWANWSPDGLTLYFTSSRDGHSCLWGQRIEPATGRPSGDSFAVRHLHGRVTYKRGGWSTAAGRIAMVLDEETGNVWMMSRPASR